MNTLDTHVDIDAPPEAVWAVLTDFDHYHEWNPFMRIAGRATENARIHVELRLSEGRSTTFRPTVTHANPGRRLQWLGHLWTPGVFDGDHRFVLERLDGGRTRLTHAETFSGVLAPLLQRLTGKATERGFEAMNAALKRQVENGDRESDPALLADASA